MRRRILFSTIFVFIYFFSYSQLKWQNVDSLYQPLPKSTHVYFTNDKIDTGTFRAYYFIADLKDKHLNFTTDTTYKRRLTPSQFYQKDDKPLVVVNGTFFSFETNQNLNIVVKAGRVVSYNAPVKGSGKDSIHFHPSYKSAIGISKKRKADIAWIKSDSAKKILIASQIPYFNTGNYFLVSRSTGERMTIPYHYSFYNWKMQTAIGGGPVLLQDGEIKITNNEEQMFAGKAINNKHPRTAMGYTNHGKLIILVIEGRSETGSGANLIQEAQILKDLNCVEALNLDGGGSSCLLINGKETIKPSDKEGERAIPAVFIIEKNK